MSTTARACLGRRLPERHARGLASLFAIPAPAVLLLMLGCGPGGPAQHHVSGRVTFRGKPVPAGVIRFLPDTAEGNQGPAGYAPIEAGHYHTAEGGRGTVGGPHRIVISGYDGRPDASGEQAHGARLFPDYHTTASLPTETTTLDFDVQ